MDTRFAQIQNPVNKEWNKVDRHTGRIVANSETMFPNVGLLKPAHKDTLRPVAETVISRRLQEIMSRLRMAHDTYDVLMHECRTTERRIDELLAERDELERPLSEDAYEPRKKLPVERVAAAFGAAMYGDAQPWGSFDERERDALKRGAHAALKEAEAALAEDPEPAPGRGAWGRGAA